MVTIITDVRVPADAFPLGRVLHDYPDVEIELQHIVPTNEGIIPLFWVKTSSEERVEKTLQTDPLVTELSQLTRTPDRILYSVNWDPSIDGLVRTIIDLNVEVLTATGTADSWEFRLQFRNRNDLQRFRYACREHHIDMTLEELFNPLMPIEKGPFTSKQKDALATAYNNGYWDVPRQITQRELASLIGVSESELSRNLRSGVKTAVGELLFGPGGKPFE